jgi:hypothetical protein
MPGLRKVVDEKDARACLAAIARSGETLGRWTQRNGIDGRSLGAWRNNLAPRSPRRPRGRTGAPAQLVELVPVTRTGSTRRYVVRVGDVRIEVGDGFDVTTLRRLVGALRAC